MLISIIPPCHVLTNPLVILGNSPILCCFKEVVKVSRGPLELSPEFSYPEMWQNVAEKES